MPDLSQIHAETHGVHLPSVAPPSHGINIPTLQPFVSVHDNSVSMVTHYSDWVVTKIQEYEKLPSIILLSLVFVIAILLFLQKLYLDYKDNQRRNKLHKMNMRIKKKHGME